MKVLIVLQNQFRGNSRGTRGRMKNPVYTSRTIHRANATYSRIVPHLEKHFGLLYFTEASSVIAGNNRDKYATDHKHLLEAVRSQCWDKIIVFGKQAEMGFSDLGLVPDYILPHPVSFKWRKQLILDVIADILSKREIDQRHR